MQDMFHPKPGQTADAAPQEDVQMKDESKQADEAAQVVAAGKKPVDLDEALNMAEQ